MVNFYVQISPKTLYNPKNPKLVMENLLKRETLIPICVILLSIIFFIPFLTKLTPEKIDPIIDSIFKDIPTIGRFFIHTIFFGYSFMGAYFLVSMIEEWEQEPYSTKGMKMGFLMYLLTLMTNVWNPLGTLAMVTMPVFVMIGFSIGTGIDRSLR